MTDADLRTELEDLERRLSRVELALDTAAATTTETRIAVAGLGAKVDGLSEAIRDLATDVRTDRTRPPPSAPVPAPTVAAAASGGSVAAAVLAVVEFAKWALGAAPNP